MLKPIMCLFMSLIVHRRQSKLLKNLFFFVNLGFMCYVLIFSLKKAFMCLLGNVLIKNEWAELITSNTKHYFRNYEQQNLFIVFKRDITNSPD